MAGHEYVPLFEWMMSLMLMFFNNWGRGGSALFRCSSQIQYFTVGFSKAFISWPSCLAATDNFSRSRHKPVVIRFEHPTAKCLTVAF